MTTLSGTLKKASTDQKILHCVVPVCQAQAAQDPYAGSPHKYQYVLAIEIKIWACHRLVSLQQASILHALLLGPLMNTDVLVSPFIPARWTEVLISFHLHQFPC